MKIIEAKNYKDMSRKAANLLSAQVILKENSVLGLATGGTAVGIYEQLIDWYQKGDLDFSAATTINLDEYVGLNGEDVNSYRYFMDHNLFNHVNLPKGQSNLPDGMAKNPEAESLRYEKLIEDLGGIDMQLLGLGENGHIGFNEPGPIFAGPTHVVDLSDNTRQVNARYFDDPDLVPTQAITMGVKQIMQAKRVLLCASGERKAKILKQVLTGPVTPQVPGSILQIHPNLTVVADDAALSCM